MSDRAGPPRTWAVEDKDFGYLFKHQEPPSSATIFLGHYRPRPGEEFLNWGQTARTNPRKLPDGREFNGYRVTFTVGHAIFEVIGQLAPELDGIVFEGP